MEHGTFEDVWILLKMVIFQPSLCYFTRGVMEGRVMVRWEVEVPPRRQLSAGTDFGETYFKSVPDALLGRD